MAYFGVSESKIITLSQKDHFEHDGKNITVLPFHEFAVTGK